MVSPILAAIDQITIAVIASSLITAALTFTVVKLLDRLRKKDAETEARDHLERRGREATNRHPRGGVGNEGAGPPAEGGRRSGSWAKIRDELRERERMLDKRQEAVEQQTDRPAEAGTDRREHSAAARPSGWKTPIGETTSSPSSGLAAADAARSQRPDPR